MRTSSIKHPESSNDLLTLARSDVIRPAYTSLPCLPSVALAKGGAKQLERLRNTP